MDAKPWLTTWPVDMVGEVHMLGLLGQRNHVLTCGGGGGHGGGHGAGRVMVCGCGVGAGGKVTRRRAGGGRRADQAW